MFKALVAIELAKKLDYPVDVESMVIEYSSAFPDGRVICGVRENERIDVLTEVTINPK